MILFFSGNKLYPQAKDSGIFSSKGRWSLSAGMGVSLINTPTFNEYLKNEIPYKSKDSIKSFSLGLEFFSAVELGVTKKLSLRFDYVYFIKSITYYYSYLTFDYFYSIHQPSLNAFYLVNGKHHQFKFGGGMGFQYIQLEINSARNYKSLGAALRGEIIYTAKLSDRLNSYLSGFVFGNFGSTLKNSDGNALISPVSGEEVNLNAFGIGARLGVSFYFN